jgi:hypothetical protein
MPFFMFLRYARRNPAVNEPPEIGGVQMKHSHVAWAAALLLAGTSLVSAGEITDLAKDAEAKLQAGQSIEAIETLRRAVALADARVPLSFRKTVFVAETPIAFGVYKPRTDNVFKSGEPLIAYAEPVGMGWTAQDGALFRSLLTADFEIRSPDGRILAGKRDFGRFEFVSHEENKEIRTDVTVNLTGATAGKYVLGVTYHDAVTGRSANFDLPFEIR